MADEKSWRERALGQGLRVLSDPRVMKWMSDPQVMKWMMRALALRSTVQEALEGQRKALIERLHLATADEVAGLKERVHELESELEVLREAEGAQRED